MGVEVIDDIMGGHEGKQLLWSYARADEYIAQNQPLFLFDNRPLHSGKIIDLHH